jgi:hypothetical protein
MNVRNGSGSAGLRSCVGIVWRRRMWSYRSHIRWSANSSVRQGDRESGRLTATLGAVAPVWSYMVACEVAAEEQPFRRLGLTSLI